jgi:Flp pilus assembly pilin Flp
MGAVVKDERGISAIETALFLPLILLIVIAGWQIWKLSMIERALYIGTDQASRYLGNNPDLFMRAFDTGNISKNVNLFVTQELTATGFYKLSMGLPDVSYRYASTDCGTPWGGREVWVSAMLELDAPVSWLEDFYAWPIRLQGSSHYNPCNQ